MLTCSLNKAKKVKAQSERSATGPIDPIQIDFDPFADFDVCAASYTPVYAGSQSTSCPFDGSKYQVEFKAQVCRICEVCEIGGIASGWRAWVQGM